MSSSKIVVDADNGKLDAANAKSAQGAKKIADEMAKISTATEKAKKSSDDWGQRLQNTVLKLSTVLGVINQIGHEQRRIREESVSASESSGQLALTRSAAIRDLGLGQGPGGIQAAISGVMSTPGGATVAERDKMLAALAASSRSAKRPIGPAVASQALDLFASGLFSENEIIEAAGKGPKDLAALKQQRDSRFQSLPAEAKAELAVRDQNRAFEIEKSGGGMSGDGTSFRVIDNARRLRDLRNGGFVTGARNVVSGALGSVPFIGDFLQESFENQDRARFLYGATEQGGRKSAAVEAVALLEQIAATNRAMSTPRPTMSPTTEAGP